MQYNFSSLNMVVTLAMIREYKRQVLTPTLLKRDKAFWVSGMVAVGAFAFALLIGAVSTVAASDEQLLVPSFLGLFAGALVLIIVVVIARTISMNGWTTAIRLSSFCRDNGFEYAGGISEPGYAGMMFSIGHTRVSTGVIRGVIEANPFEFGTYGYLIGYGKTQRGVSLGYIRIQLDRKLPHMVLDAAKNNHRIFGIQSTNLPVAYSKDQAMRLEGDFNDHFQLYAPVGYERDALYVFSPDLMALFIDEVGTFDAEIVDDFLYIYTPVAIQYKDVAYMQRIMRIIEVVGKKMSDQTDRYQDERAVQQLNTVAIQGQRLRKGPTFISIVIIFVLFIYFAVQLVGLFQ